MSFSSKVNMSERARWYVVHTYSGYENKVKANLEKTVENRNHELYFRYTSSNGRSCGKKKMVNKRFL